MTGSRSDSARRSSAIRGHAAAIAVVLLAALAPSAADGAVTFAVVSDVEGYAGPGGYDTDDYFRGACEALALVGPGDFMISPGDFGSLSGVRWTLDRTLGRRYALYPVLGNHEADTDEAMAEIRDYPLIAPDGDRAPLFHWGPKGAETTMWSFDYGNCHFVAINEYFDGVRDDALDGDVSDPVYEWLAADLEATTKDHVFVFGHEPAYPRPDRDNLRERHMDDSLNLHSERRDRFWNLLVDRGVDAYVCGHTHNHSVFEKNGVWQIDAGHCRGRGDLGASSTFLLFRVDGPDVECVAYREVHDNGDYDYDDLVHVDWLNDAHVDPLPIVATGVSESVPGAPHLTNAPNPFNPSTYVSFELRGGGACVVRIADLRGVLVRTLVDRFVPAGAHRVEWDGRAGDGRPAPSGVYFAELRSGGETARRKIVLVR